MSSPEIDQCLCKQLDVPIMPQRVSLIQSDAQMAGLGDELDDVQVAGFDMEMSTDSGTEITVIQVSYVKDNSLVIKVLDMMALSKAAVFENMLAFLRSEGVMKVGADIRQDALAVYGDTGIKMSGLLELASLSFLFDHDASCTFIRDHLGKKQISLNSLSTRFIREDDRSYEKTKMKRSFTGRSPLSPAQVSYVVKDAAHPLLIYMSILRGLAPHMQKLVPLDYCFHFVVDESALARRTSYLAAFPNGAADHEEISDRWMRNLTASTNIQAARPLAVDYIIDNVIRHHFALNDGDVRFVKSGMSPSLAAKELSPLVYNYGDHSHQFLEARSLALKSLRPVYSQPNLSLYADHLGDMVIKCLRIKKFSRVVEDDASDEGHE